MIKIELMKNHSQGIGKLLLNKTIEKAKQLNFKKLYLFTFDPSIPSYYEKLGWKKIGTDEFNSHPVTLMEVILCDENDEAIVYEYGIHDEDTYSDKFDIEDMIEYDIKLLEKRSHGLDREYPRYCPSFSINTVKEFIEKYNHKTNNDVTAGYIAADVERLRKPMQLITDYILKCMGVIKSAEGIAIQQEKMEL